MMGQVHDIVFDDQALQVLAIFLDEERWIGLEEGEVATGPAAVFSQTASNRKYARDRFV